MAIAADDKAAFRCKECGHLEDSGSAGENALPHACSVCGSGVKFNPRTGVKTADPDNWEILSDTTPEKLTEYGLKPEDVAEPSEALVAMKAAKVNPAAGQEIKGKKVAATASEGLGAKDKG